MANKKSPSKSPKKSPKKAASPAKKPAAKVPKATKKAATNAEPEDKPRIKRSAAPQGPVDEEVATPDEATDADAPNPEPLPQFVREASPAERKAAVEALALDAGVAPILARAPWRRQAGGAGDKKEGPKQERHEPLRMSAPRAPEASRPIGVSGKRPVLLDTNALMMQFQFHIDVERELARLLDFGHEIVVPSVVMEELEALAKEAKGKDAGEARMALELAKTFRVMTAPGQGDTSILRLAQELGNAIVVTNDKLLRARLRAKDIPNIYMRSSAFLTLEGHISGI